ncbi:hypothetical protein HEBU111660_08915 [Helicobacter burdigaliensis]
MDNPNYDANKPINVNDIIKDNTTGSGKVDKDEVTIGSGNELIEYEYNPITGKVESKLQVAKGMGSIMAQTLINTYIMRSFFIDTVVDEASRMAYKHARTSHDNKDLKGFSIDEHYHGFIMPYASYNSIDLVGSADTSSGNTRGIIAGFHTLRDFGMFGAFVGTEKADMDAGDFLI